jgi:hypothetical protein
MRRHGDRFVRSGTDRPFSCRYAGNTRFATTTSPAKTSVVRTSYFDRRLVFLIDVKRDLQPFFIRVADDHDERAYRRSLLPMNLNARSSVGRVEDHEVAGTFSNGRESSRRECSVSDSSFHGSRPM